MQPAEDATLAPLVRRELGEVLASPEFANADLIRAFLKFVVETSLEGNPSYLKESVIGTQVFGRAADYNPKLDPVVRMAARRLREKLEAYYAERGERPIRISLPKGGYVPQFSALAEPAQAAAPPVEVPQQVRAAVVPPPVQIARRPSRVWVAVAAAVVLAGAVWLLRNPAANPATTLILDSRPFTSLAGHVSRPAFSPDGNSMAFDWDGPDNGLPHVWTQKLGADTPVRVTANPAVEVCATWLPDGRRIAFLRTIDAERRAIISVNPDGSGEQKHAEIQIGERETPGLSWSPDGQSVVTANRPTQAQPSALVLITAGGSQRRLTDPPNGVGGDSQPAFSPDGRQIAFRRTVSVTIEDVWVVDTTGEHLHRVTQDNRGVGGIAWMRNGRELIFTSKRAGSVSSLWRVPLSGGSPVRLTPTSLEAGAPTVSSGGKLAFVRSVYDVNIWQLEPGSGAAPHPLLASTLLDSGPQFSPDGGRIAFRSTRGGSDEVWIYDRARQTTTRVTNIGGPLTGSARWSPDGRRLAFETHRDGKSDIYLMDATGGSAQILANEPGSHILPSWSHDGAAIYFTSDSSGRSEIWRHGLSGTVSEQVTHEGGLNAFESTDGKWLYYAKPRQSGLWRLPEGGGPEEQVLTDLIPSYWGNWALAPQGIYYIRENAPHTFAIVYYDLKSRTQKAIHTLSGPPVGSDSGLAVSADGRMLLYCQVDGDGSNILLAEGLSQ